MLLENSQMKSIRLIMQITIDADNVAASFDLLWHTIEKGTVQCSQAFSKATEKTLAEISRPSAPAATPVPTMPPKTSDGEQPLHDKSGLIDANAVASLLKVSPRTVWRLNDVARMPKSVRIGSLVRWNYDEIMSWMAAKCPAREQRTERRMSR
jgi:predicted DNA-binding transcriptional regulator AlpA